MATGIMIVGAPGVGKTTLGEFTAKELGYTFLDIDEYIWHKDTDIPFSQMYSKAEKISRLMDAVSKCEHFVMAGSMDSFHEHFDPFFKLVVHLCADAEIREARVREREFARYGKRILQGGDMHDKHERFLSEIRGYDLGIGGCTLQQHELWLKSLPCKVIRLDGADALHTNMERIIEAYTGACDIQDEPER